MGYGNPLFDGDQPLPPMRKLRPVSLRAWLRALLRGMEVEGEWRSPRG